MKTAIELPHKLEQLSDEEKLHLFNVEELETRLEMAAVATTSSKSAHNDGCTTNSSCGW